MRQLKTRFLHLTLAAVLTVSASVSFSATFQGLVYSTSDTVKRGEWTSRYYKARDYAEKNNLPLVVVWASSGCGYCTGLASNLATSQTDSWMATRGFVFVFARDVKTAEATAAHDFARYGSNYPFCRVYWKKNADGKTVNSGFCGRSGSYAMDASAFRTKIDKLTQSGAYSKRYQVTVVSDTSGCKVKGGGSCRYGTSTKLTASAKSGYVFAGWYLGSTRLTQKPSYSYAVPTKDVTVTGKFIKRSDDSASISFSLKSEYAKGNTMTSVAVSASGKSLPSVAFTGLPKGMKYASGKISGKPSKSGIYTVTGRCKTAGGAVATKTASVVVRGSGERVVRVSCASEAGTVSGSGVYADGKKATVTAKAKSGYVFREWVNGKTRLSTSAKYACPVSGKDLALTANFVTKAAERASVTLKVDGRPLAETTVLTNEMCRGVRMSWPVVRTALTATSVSASGLPKGLKLTKVSDGSYALAGVPTTASKTDTRTGRRIPTVAKLTVTTAGKNKVTYRLALVVTPQPSWATGSFSGFATLEDGGYGVGKATVSVSSAGKISGKFTLGGTNWTFSVTGYASQKTATDETARRFVIAATAKSGKARTSVDLTIVPGWRKGALSRLGCSTMTGTVGKKAAFEVNRNFWSDGDKTLPALSKGTFYPSEPAYAKVQVKVASNGKVSFAGKLADGTKLSTSAIAFFTVDETYAVWLIINAKKKATGVVKSFDLP